MTSDLHILANGRQTLLSVLTVKLLTSNNEITGSLRIACDPFNFHNVVLSVT